MAKTLEYATTLPPPPDDLVAWAAPDNLRRTEAIRILHRALDLDRMTTIRESIMRALQLLVVLGVPQ